MSDNEQKYKNWKAITESDYITMFIKTWFAFIIQKRILDFSADYLVAKTEANGGSSSHEGGLLK